MATLSLGVAQLADGQHTAALGNLTTVRRTRLPAATLAREAATTATVVAQTRTGDLTGALGLLQSLSVPGDPALRRAFAAAARALGRELVLDERAEEALPAWQRALEAEPGHAPSRRALGHLHDVLGTRAVRRDDFAAAVPHWEAALAVQPDNMRILRNLALAEERLERWEQAGAHWEELTKRWMKALREARRDDEETAKELRQRLTVAWRRLAATYEARDDLAAAARTLERALNFDAADVDLRLRAAELHLEDERYASAIGHLERVLAVRPSDTRVLIDLGTACDLKGDDRRAQGYLEQALALEPANQAARSVLAGVHHARGHRLLDSARAEQALAEFTRAAEVNPGYVGNYECLGDAYLRLGRLDDARHAFERSLAIDPEDARSRVAIGGIYLSAGYEKEAQKLFREALRLDRSPLTNLSIGLAYIQAGRPAEANKQFDQVLKGRDPLLNLLLGKMLIQVEREDAAVPFLERAVSLDPASTRARLDLAWAYTFGAGDYDRAAIEIAVAERVAMATSDAEALAEIKDAKQSLAELQEGVSPAVWPGAVRAAWR